MGRHVRGMIEMERERERKQEPIVLPAEVLKPWQKAVAARKAKYAALKAEKEGK